MKKLAFALLAAFTVFAMSAPIFTFTQAILLGIIALMIALWTNDGLPMAAVSLLPVVLFPSFGIMDTEKTGLNYANPIIFLFLGGFFLAIAVEKTALHRWIVDSMLTVFPNTARGIVISLVMTSGLLSSILTNTTTTLLLISIALHISDKPPLKARFALAIAYGASIGGILTPIGTPPNLILLGIMQEKGMAEIPFFQWIWMVSPLVLLMCACVGFILGIGVENEGFPRKNSRKPLTAGQKKVLAVLIGLTVVLLINAPIRPYWHGLGLSEPGVVLAAGLLLFVPPLDLLNWVEDRERIPFQIMFLFGAGFAIAKAVSQTKIDNEIASYLTGLTELGPTLMLLCIAALVTFMTEITSNTALTTIMLPIVYAVAEQAGVNTPLFMMAATVCASYAFMLPIATMPNAIAMASGVVDIKTMAAYGFVFNLIGIVLIMAVFSLFWQHTL